MLTKPIGILLSLSLIVDVAQAATLVSYTGKLRKAYESAGEVIYKLELDSSDGDIVPAAVRGAIDQKLGAFEVSNLEVDTQPYFSMTVERLGDLQLAIRFAVELEERQAYLSCFQSWFADLPRASTNEPNQLVLEGHLAGQYEDTVSELRNVYGPLLRTYLEDEFRDCMLAYDSWQINDSSGFLYTGVTRWLDNRISQRYFNFTYLLDGTRGEFSDRFADLPASVDATAFIRTWLTIVKGKATPELVLTRFAEATDLRAEDASPSHLVVRALRLWAPRQALLDFVDDGEASQGLRSVFGASDILLGSCFTNVGQNFSYACGAGEDIRRKLVLFEFSSRLSGDFGFLVGI